MLTLALIFVLSGIVMIILSILGMALELIVPVAAFLIACVILVNLVKYLREKVR